MSKELEEAIKSLKEDRDSYIEASQCGLGYPSDNREHKEKAQAIETVLNYIEKLQEENEQMKLEKNSRLIGKYGEIEVHELINKVLSKDYIPKQNVIEKIKEIETARNLATLLIENRIIIADNDSLYKGEEIAHNCDIKVLQELLEGNR